MKKIFDLVSYILIALFFWIVGILIIVTENNIHVFMLGFIFVIHLVGIYQLIKYENVIRNKMVAFIISLANACVVSIFFFIRFVAEALNIHPALFILIFFIYNFLIAGFIFLCSKKRRDK